MEPEHASGSNEQVNKNSVVKHDASNPFVDEKIPDHSPSLSRSSSSSFELDTGDKSFSKEDGALSPEEGSESSPDLSHTPQWSMMSVSPRAGAGSMLSPELSPQVSDWSTLSTSQLKSPPNQSMGRPAGYDPNRIPSSVFTSKPTTPMEWSVASNESLFSIHMGNNSFSRDQAFLFSKSGELPVLEEWNNTLSNPYSGPEPKSNEPNNSPSGLPPLIEVPPDKEENSVRLGGGPRVEKEESDKNLKVVPKGTAADHANEKISPTGEVSVPATPSHVSDSKGANPAEARVSASTPRLSDESGNSGSSFAFPVLVNDGAKNGSSKLASDRSVKSEKAQLEQQDSKGAAKPPETRWFTSCLSCWPRCC